MFGPFTTNINICLLWAPCFLRLKNAEPVSYSELHTKTEKGSKVVKSGFIEEGAKEEVYTEDHEKLLGTCQIAWTLFVDGYDKDGKRIYDQVRGKTCHQCR
jgi:cell division cycle-associated protein 7